MRRKTTRARDVPVTLSQFQTQYDWDDGAGDGSYQCLETRSDTKRKKAPPLRLSDAQEEDVVEWLQSHPELYDRNNKMHRESKYKEQLWDEKAKELELENGMELYRWYQSMRTRFGKLNKRKDGDGAKELTSRDEWIKDRFQFMGKHIYEQPKRSYNLLVKRLSKVPQVSHPSQQFEEAGPSAAMTSGASYRSLSDSEFEDPDDRVILPEPVATPTTCSPSLFTAVNGGSYCRSKATPMFALSDGCATSQPLMGGLIAHQTCHIDPTNMTQTYGQFLASCAANIDESLMPEFYQESFQLVMRYNNHTLSLKRKRSEEQSPSPNVKKRLATAEGHTQGPFSDPAQYPDVKPPTLSS